MSIYYEALCGAKLTTKRGRPSHEGQCRTCKAIKQMHPKRDYEEGMWTPVIDTSRAVPEKGIYVREGDTVSLVLPADPASKRALELKRAFDDAFTDASGAPRRKKQARR